MFKVLKNNLEYKKCVISSFNDTKSEFIQENKLKIALCGLLGGILAGMIGVGGGMISTPLLLTMGFNPKV